MNVVEATILTGSFKGENVLIPRIPKIPTDTLFQFKRLQFTIRLAFAVTINKAKDQSLELCDLDLDALGEAHVVNRPPSRIFGPIQLPDLENMVSPIEG